MTAPMWYSQKQMAHLLGVRLSAISHRIAQERKKIPFGDGERIQPFTVSGRVYQVRFYDVWALFRVTSGMRIRTNKRSAQIFHAGCAYAASVLMGNDERDERFDKLLSIIESVEDYEVYRGGFVYLLSNRDGLCKIGMTIDPITRIKELEREHGPLEQLALIETDDRYGTERHYHERFAKQRVHLEWFALSDDDIASIQDDMQKASDGKGGAK